MTGALGERSTLHINEYGSEITHHLSCAYYVFCVPVQQAGIEEDCSFAEYIARGWGTRPA